MNKIITIGLLFFLTFFAQGEEINLAPELEKYYRDMNLSTSFVDKDTVINIVLKQEVMISKGEEYSTSDATIFFHTLTQTIVVSKGVKGTNVFLQRNDTQWMYTKSLRSPLRISSSQDISGDYSLFDVLNIAIHEYEVILREDSVLSLKDAEGKKPYAQIKVYFNPQSKNIEKFVYLGRGGRAIKEMRIEGYDVLYSDRGKHRMPRQIIRNVFLNTERQSRVATIAIRKENMAASLFYPKADRLRQFIDRFGNE